MSPPGHGQGQVMAQAAGGVAGAEARCSEPNVQGVAESAAGPALSDGGSREMYSSSSSEEEDLGRHLEGKGSGGGDTTRDQSSPGNLWRLPVAGGGPTGGLGGQRAHLPGAASSAGEAEVLRGSGGEGPSTSAHARMAIGGPCTSAHARMGIGACGLRCEASVAGVEGPRLSVQAGLSMMGPQSGAQAGMHGGASGHIGIAGSAWSAQGASTQGGVLDAVSDTLGGNATRGRGWSHAGITHVMDEGAQFDRSVDAIH
ncbi:WAG22 antigen-like [Bombina bombina]|uniref:WAG22 antigen-like n=1 Tax=Bombina bombina TaxID=8345 RepID=UPI00235AF810|nr:WAG22 antigen-like [Bombina bombina]